MGLLVALSYTMRWVFLRQAIANPLVALAGFLALVFNGWFCFLENGHHPTERYLNLYFQYLPIRFIFPAVAVLLAWAYARRPGRWLYWRPCSSCTEKRDAPVHTDVPRLRAERQGADVRRVLV